MSETTELMARAAQLTALALCGGLPVLPHGPHYDTCPACEPVRVAQGLADALAAARAEVETLTRDRDGWERRTKELGSVVIRAWALLRDWWQYAQLEEREEPFVDALTRALAADAEHDAYALAEIRRWRDVAGEAARLAQEGTDAT